MSDSNARHLIVNADDFGISAGVNNGIAMAHELGIVTSTSLMVRWPAAKEAADYAADHPALGIGLHVDLGEWIYRDGEWQVLYEVVANRDSTAVSAELDAQIAAFRQLIGRDPTHLDSHQHVHRDEPLRTLILDRGQRLGIPVRHFYDPIRYCGDFYAQDNHGGSWPDQISVNGLIRILRSLQPGTTELCCHPGIGVDLEASYLKERSIETQTLCDPRVRETVDDCEIKLANFLQTAA